MSYLFTSESVSEGHPDKVSDQISDALLDEFLKQDPNSKVAVETLVTTGLAVLSGEVKTKSYVDVQQVARDVINEIGYTQSSYRFDGNSCGVLSSIHEQSPDISRGVNRDGEVGAGDQGMMFGYASKETDAYMPLAQELAHRILLTLKEIRTKGRRMKYLGPDAKAQVTVEYNDKHRPQRVDTIVISTQHDEFIETNSNRPEALKSAEKKMLTRIQRDMESIVLPKVRRALPRRLKKFMDKNFKLYVNPTGKFVIGGPHGDTGLTGRKIIVDTYGGKGAHGGGAFSGKDASKVDRSAAYAARHIAKNMVAAGVADEMLVQVSYAIGVTQPVSLMVNTYNTVKARTKDGKKYTDEEIAQRISEIFDLRPKAIIDRLGLLNPIFRETSAYGHVGRDPFTKEVEFQLNGEKIRKEVEFFTWEKLDYTELIRQVFNL